LRHFLKTEYVLRAYLLAATGDMEEAEDQLQEVSSVLWEKYGSYDQRRPFRAWALGIARIEVLKSRQRHARRREVLSGEALEVLAETAVDTASEADLRKTYLRACVEKLSKKAREVVRLRYLEGLRMRDIAGRLRKSVAAVEMLLVRVRRALRECVERQLRGMGEPSS